MVAINPFRALRFNPQQAGDLSQLISPPYDVIGPAEQDRLYGRSAHNIIRLILGKESPDDSPADNRYTRARRDFDAWRASGVLQQDAAPAIYVIEHTFQAAGARHVRLGFIALFELTDTIEASVFRHEATLSGPKQDRTKLMEAVPANLEPIFCAYPDPQGKAQGLLREVTTSSAPTVQASMNGDAVKVWVVTDARVTGSLAGHLKSHKVLIADGHHRFEVAHANRQRYGALMSYFVSMEEPALVVRPIHRIIRGERPMDAQMLARSCRLEPQPDLQTLLAKLETAQGAGQFGCFDGKTFALASIQPQRQAQWTASPTVPLPVAMLDVSILHHVILPDAFGGAQNFSATYTHNAEDAVEAVTRGEAKAAWFLRGIPLPQVYALASQGFCMPPKSTYFYPKVPSGLAINPLG